MRVLQAAGVETEVDLAFAGLLQLVRPVLAGPTVERGKYHLYKAYPKLGVTSRAELARLDLDALVTE